MSWARGMVFKTDVDTVDAQLKVINDFGDESSHCGIVVLGRQLLIHAGFIFFNRLHQHLDNIIQLAAPSFDSVHSLILAFHHTLARTWGRRLQKRHLFGLE